MMKKWLRWQGLVAFGVIVCVVGGCFYFIAGALIEKGIETVGTKVVGARVELDDVRLSLFPVGIGFKGLRVTNPDSPMENAVEVGMTELFFDTGGMILRKIIVTEMAVEGVMFNTPRKTSGAIEADEKQKPEKVPDEPVAGELKLPIFEVPDVKSILAGEKLASLDEAKKLKEEILAAGGGFEQEIQTLPDKKTFEAYRSRINTLKAKKFGFKDILGRSDEIKILMRDIESETGRLKKSRSDLTNTISQLNTRIRNVARLPLEDYSRLRNKYDLSPRGMGNITGLLLGPEYTGRVEKALTWYLRLKPLLEGDTGKPDDDEKREAEASPLRGKGVDVVFREKNPLPDFLIKKTSAYIKIAAGDMNGVIKNITNEQGIAGNPITYRFTGKELKGIHSVVIDGILNHIKPERSADTLHVSVKGYGVHKLRPAEKTGLDITLEKGAANLDMDTTIRGDRIESGIKLVLQAVEFSAENAGGSSRTDRAIHSALSDITGFSVDASISGTLDNYDMTLKSDLDGVVKKAISGIAKQLSKEFSNNLKQAIEAKTGGEMKSLQNSMAGLASIDKELAKRVKLGDELLTSKLF